MASGLVRGWRWAAWAALGVCVASAGMGRLALDGWDTQDHLRRAAVLLQDLQEHIEARDGRAAAVTLARLRAETRAARANTTSWAWRGAGHSPVLGADLSAVSIVSRALDDFTHRGLPALVEVSTILDPATLAPVEGRIRLDSLTGSVERLGTADTEIRRAEAAIAGIDTSALSTPVGTAVTAARQRIAAAAARIGTALRAALLLPAMLGADGPRTYLVLFQNLAEVRATGGMAGAFAVVRTDRGAISIVEQGSAAGTLGKFPAPVLPLDAAMADLYTDRLGMFPADVNFTPHFPTAASLARQMYRLRSGREVDGVLATDPVALSYLLAATGPVRLSTGTVLSADNAVRLLLSDAYAMFPGPGEQDRFFAEAARATFEALTSGDVDPAAAIAGLVRAAGERRLLVWSTHEAERSSLTGTVLEGSMPATDGARPAVGVFLNDGTGAKLDYYLSSSLVVGAGGCRVDGRREIWMRIGLTSTAPSAGLPADVLGLALGGAPYVIRTNVMIFSPAGGSVLAVRRDGRDDPVGVGSERGRVVAVSTVDLAPGASVTLDVTVVTGPPAPEAVGTTVTPDIWTTPGVEPWRIKVDSLQVCAITS